MARPKKGAKGCEKANRKWRETMLKRYGGREALHKQMQSIGRVGGLNGHTGGLYGNPEKAREIGAKGGAISKRKSKYLHIFEYNRDEIIGAVNGATTLKSLARELRVPYPALLHYVNVYIKNRR